VPLVVSGLVLAIVAAVLRTGVSVPVAAGGGFVVMLVALALLATFRRG
jgi:hypothetical protein